MTVRVQSDPRGYALAALHGLLAGGWQLSGLPSDGKLKRNQQLLGLEYFGTRKQFRLLIFKVGASGRNRPTERRIEATSTYAGGGLAGRPDVEDVLLGFDDATAVFVGFDTRRLEHGGATQNASAFFDVAELARAVPSDIHIVPRESGLFGLEYHAFVHPIRIAEYLVNRAEIHRGVYTGAGQFSGHARARRVTVARESVSGPAAIGDVVWLKGPSSGATAVPSNSQTNSVMVEALEAGGIDALKGRRITPRRFEEILLRARINGELGEQLVLEAERKRLRLAGKQQLSHKVRWISQEDVAAGYDVESFETNGDLRRIEVKATSGAARRFMISRNEWKKATRHRNSYWIYLVTSVTSHPRIERYRDPVGMEAAGHITLEEREWIVIIP